jgi:Predicted alternative 3-dehydroquinate synthase
MKEFWVDIRPWKKELATAAIESGADVIVADHAGPVHELGRVKVVAPDGDLLPGKDVFEVKISGKESETEVLNHSKNGYVIVTGGDWTVIPLENLVAQSDRIIAAVKDEKEAEVALNVLEKGTQGILLRTDSVTVIRKVAGLVRAAGEHTRIEAFTVTSVRPAGMGDRVCVDTCSMLSDGQGMLVGNTSSAFLLVHAETLENPYVSPRPFRVNAGAVHAYAMVPDGKTAYLSDLKIGDRVCISDASGNLYEVTVGRVKIEKRPLLLVEAESGGAHVSLVLQNAETIRLVREDGSALSVVDLSPGDRVIGCTMESGRHFGIAIKEHILEK